MNLKIDEEFKSLIPPLSAEEYAQLEQNLIKETNPESIVLLTWEGYLIDGHNRFEICRKHNIEFKVAEKDGFKDREDAKIWIIQNQFGRRNINNYQRSVLALRLEDIFKTKAKDHQTRTFENRVCQISDKQETPIDTKKELAKIAKVSHDTIAKVKKIEEKAAPEVKKKLEKGEATINEVYKEIKKEEQKEERRAESQKAIENLPEMIERYQIIHGDFREQNIEPNSIDLILTDPPYPGEFLPLWKDLASFAKKVLKPSGFLVAYSGQFHLPTVINSLSEDLTYYWCMSLNHNGANQLVHARNVFCEWKPILIFQKEPFKIIRFPVADIINGSGREKSLHEWQQGLDELLSLINGFSKEGDTILDPFAGSGTTLLSSLKNNRKGIAIEKEEEHINTIRNRVYELQKQQ